MEYNIIDWGCTRNALHTLEKSLECPLCFRLLQEPCSLGNCDHAFCRSCVEDHLGNTCPQCSAPAWVKDLQPNRQLTNVVYLCKKLRKIVEGKYVQKMDSNRNGDMETESKKCMTALQTCLKSVHVAPLLKHAPSTVSNDTGRRGNRPRRTASKDVEYKEDGDEDDDDDDDDDATDEEEERIESADDKDEDFEPFPEKKQVVSKRKPKAKRLIALKSSNAKIETKFSPKSSILRYTVNLRGRETEGNRKGKVLKGKGRRYASGVGNRECLKELTSSDENQLVGVDTTEDVFNFVASPSHQKQTKRKKQPARKTTKAKKAGNESKKRNLRNRTSLTSVDEKESASVQEDDKNLLDCEEDETVSRQQEDEDIEVQKPRRASRARNRKNEVDDKDDATMCEADETVSRDQDDEDIEVQKPRRGKRATNRKNLEVPKRGKSGENTMRSRVSNRKRLENGNSGENSTSKDEDYGETKNMDHSDVHPGKRVTRKRRSTEKEDETVKTRKVKSAVDNTVKCTRRKSMTHLMDNQTPLKSTRGRRSTDSPRGASCTPQSSRTSTGPLNSPYGSLTKKNHKGETVLHKATVKGDLETVKTLLDAGADPNTKDFAGWTPLQEACNYGYVDMVSLLIDNGAYINTPGLENNTALHDAVSHHKMEIVSLLVQKGASVNSRNNHGLTPKDLAYNDEMRAILDAQPTIQPTPLTTSPKLDPTIRHQNTDVVVIGTGLKREQRVKLEQFAKLVNGRVVEDFDGSVSHVVTVCNDDGQCPRTMKFLQGVLGGKWIISYEWIKTCLEKKKYEDEQYFEVTGTTLHPFTLGPRKARLNYEQQCPGLFTGCHFYFHGTFNPPTPTKSELADLVKAGDGVVLTREPKLDDCNQLGDIIPYHSQPTIPQTECTHYIVYDQFTKNPPTTKTHSGKLCTISSLWLMNCISQFSLLEHV